MLMRGQKKAKECCAQATENGHLKSDEDSYQRTRCRWRPCEWGYLCDMVVSGELVTTILAPVLLKSIGQEQWSQF